ncbi:SAP domain-containing ribonucleoprotein [Cyclospora cayetanensis]|uniref:SAP domain-containing ribonucleoprotein n=1 Tax=Cyclospora cayetanensis TaxID=88456 RepID=A0A6P6RYN3_9EIME|nr:SAP domain-containing ribonucleoprotein [Cyclospora cayetanensis]
MTQLAAADYSNLKVADLRNLLAEKGLPTTGKKTELIERLQSATQSVSSVDAALVAAVSPDTSSNAHAGTSAEDDSAGAAGAPLSAALGRHPVVKPANGLSPDAVAPASGATSAVSSITPAMSEEEKLAARKAKFGIKTDKDKLQERAKRFGLFDPAVEEEKKKQRAQRFGLSPSSAAASTQVRTISTEEAEKRKKRAERFGIVDEEERKRKRAERFGIESEEEKLQKRLQRFAGSATA